MAAAAKRPRRVPKDEEDWRVPNLAARRGAGLAQPTRKAGEQGLRREDVVRHGQEVRED